MILVYPEDLGITSLHHLQTLFTPKYLPNIHPRHLHTLPAPLQMQCGSTPLHRASENGHLEIVRLLLDRGADKEAKDEVCGEGIGGAVNGNVWRCNAC